ncbi:DUF2330 domain-containing protein [Antarctobacter heliothermus]|uniref:DUF2330 domain-containing protein n=1 Tax=Antarctobacter heliothermus TaxID=74033 RepID=A0A239CG17_9RHOB|nr:DUF2330 domain-containing protein [Antarctobacter heliothermus]SNS18618.1 hypothetical protein SAMN04488078_1006108 [Antarctobacter heliothermus]
MTRIFLALLFSSLAASAQAFCGFYVAKADGSLFNESSKVVFVRDGDRSAITMSSDYRGAPKDFALIVPTPRVLLRDQIRTVEAETVQHLDDYTAPRLVEYHDRDPCAPIPLPMISMTAVVNEAAPPLAVRARSLGVTIEAEYAVGTYDILILGAEQSDGLVTFLTGEGYNMPEGGEETLQQYIDGGMKFFVAGVNLERHAEADTKELPPLQIEFTSKDFMLPIQLGKLNADGPQDALFFMLSRTGRVVPTNYVPVQLPSNMDVPLFVEEEFGDFYRALFAQAAPDEGGIVVEYAWDMAWCDPCAADPLTNAQLAELGVDWLPEETGTGPLSGQNVYVTRLHARYEGDQMAEDVFFRATEDRQNFQGRYVMNHPYTGETTCEAGKDYVLRTRARVQDEARALARLTGWDEAEMLEKARASVPSEFR